MFATQDALEPAEEKFHLPAVTISQGNQFGVKLKAIGGQEENFRASLRIGLAGFDFNETERLFETRSTLRAAQMNDEITSYSGGLSFGGERTFFDNGVHGVVSYSANEMAVRIDDVLEELIFGIAAIDDVESARLKGLP